MMRTTERCPVAFHADTISAECIHRLAPEADATDGVLCKDHVPTAQEGSSEDILDECLWIALEIFTRLHQDDFQDMDAVTRWAQDFPTPSHDVPEEDKRGSIRHAVETWLDMGNEEFSRQLAERVCNESSVEFTVPFARPFGGSSSSSPSERVGERGSSGAHTYCGGGRGGRINSQGIRLRAEGEPQKVATFLFPVQYNLKAKVANRFDFRDGKPHPESRSIYI